VFDRKRRNVRRKTEKYRYKLCNRCDKETHTGIKQGESNGKTVNILNNIEERNN
jgi:hypothetical protein